MTQGKVRTQRRSQRTGAKDGAPRRRAAASISSDALASLQNRLRELTETVDALRSGAVDAVVVNGPNGSQIYSLTGAEHPYRIYVERMQEGAATVSPEGVILYANQRFSEMVRLPLEQVISSTMREHIGQEAWNEIADALGRAGRPVKHTSLLRRRDAPSLPISLAASGLQIDAREMLCLVVTDLTEQQHTAELQLAKDLAEQANVAKDAFLAALSHELRTPLTPALVSAAAIEADPALPAHLAEEIAVVRRNVELEARLIDDLLDLTRIARGKLEMHIAPLVLDSLVEDAIAICRPDIAARHLTLEVVKDAAEIHTTGDAVRLQQVLWNLLRNAVKFTPENGRLTVRMYKPAADRVAIDISDTGIGFDQHAAAKLFNAFEQGGREITRQFGGLGLGLAISRSIAEAHRGTIRARSDGPGRGACFTLELPFSADAAERADTPHEAQGTGGPAAGLRILLVEDHRDTRVVLERALRRQQHDVQAAGDARGALDLAERHHFDIVISDLGLPDQSGLELMRQLRDRFGLRGIAVSGYGMDEDVAKSHSAGFVHHLTKPVSVQRLRQLVGAMAR